MKHASLISVIYLRREASMKYCLLIVSALSVMFLTQAFADKSDSSGKGLIERRQDRAKKNQRQNVRATRGLEKNPEQQRQEDQENKSLRYQSDDKSDASEN
jgi:hypothetical protein